MTTKPLGKRGEPERKNIYKRTGGYEKGEAHMKNTLIIIGIIAILVTGCSSTQPTKEFVNTQPTKEFVKIGVLTPLSGPVAEYGQNSKMGIDLAAQEINAAGGIDGKQIQLYYEDSKCDPKEAVNGFKKLTEVDGVKIVLGTVCSGELLAIAPLANEQKILVISEGASSPAVTSAGDYIFRVYASDDYDAKIGAETIYKKFGKTTVGVLYINNDYGLALKNSFTKKFSELGGTIAAEESYGQDAADMRTQLLKIKQAKPSAVYFISYPKDATIAVKQAKEASIDALFFGTSSLKSSDFVSESGANAEGMVISSPAAYSSSIQKAFTTSYEGKFNLTPGLLSDKAYDSLFIVKQAYSGAKSIEEVKNNLYAVAYAGASGTIKFDENGDLKDLSYDLWKVENSTLVALN